MRHLSRIKFRSFYKLTFFSTMDHSKRFSNSMLSAEKPNFVANEESILAYWTEIKAFEQQLEKTKNLPPFTFYDGPPFATGTPHYGHICAGTIKDVITRYASMKGHYVERRFGWDCHGLPIENLIDKQLGITNRKQVEEMGIGVYNDHCRSIVMRYSSEWRTIVNRLGRWIDFDNDYKTMDLSFMESVWWVFKQIFDKGLVYKGCRVMPYSNKCNTVLSNFEAGLNYQMISDPSIVISFPLKEDPETSFLAWTTTPWTLPSNLALSVNPDFEYVKILDLKTKRKYIMAKCRLIELYKSAKTLTEVDKTVKQEKKMNRNKNDKKKGKTGEPEKIEETPKENEKEEAVEEKEFEILESFTGKQLEFKEYIPLFDYYFNKMHPKGCFRVLCGYHVTSEAGTGIVHTAPAFGEEDYKICHRYKVIDPADPCVCIDANGHFLPVVRDFSTEYIKDADKKIVQHLKQSGRIIKNADFKHSYPMCWRSNTPLVYKAVDTWFIKVTAVKENLVNNNKKAHWVPQWAQEKRFNNWLETAEDWCFSRDRFWGNPIPLWVSDDGEEVVCIGSVEELKKRANLPSDFVLNDLHKEFVDKITIPSAKGKGVLKRVGEVFDCWFESGSMPYASVNYPFKMTEKEFQARFPADFIGEGLDQTRGWFYTLNVIGTILFDSCPYKNLIVNGIVLDEHGQKLSKSKGNYPDPNIIINSVGSDPLRLYLMNSPLVRAESLNFSEKDLRNLVKDFFNPWYNLVRLLLQEIKRFEHSSGNKFVYNESLFLEESPHKFDNILDKWILAKTHSLIQFINNEFQAYRLYTVLDEKMKFLDQLSHWYANLNKNRFKGDNGVQDASLSLNVLFHCLLNSTIMMAPFVPFITDYFYLNLKHFLCEKSSLLQESIHFLSIPTPTKHFFDDSLLESVNIFQNVITSVRYVREKRGVNLKQPITSLKLMPRNKVLLQKFKTLEHYFKDESNVFEITLSEDYEKYVEFNVLPKDDFLGQMLKDKYGPLRPKLRELTTEQKDTFLKTKSLSIEAVIKGVKETFTFDEQGLTLVPFIKAKPEKPEQEIMGNENYAYELDFTITEELKLKGLARETVNRIQRFRKLSKLSIDDRIFIVVDIPESSPKLKKAFEAERTYIQNIIKKPLFSKKEIGFNFSLFIEEFDVEGEKLTIEISGESIVFDWNEVAKVSGNEETLKNLRVILSGYSFRGLKLSGKKSIQFQFQSKAYTLNEGTHYKMY